MIETFKSYLLSINRYESRNFILENNNKLDVIEEVIIPALIEIGEGWENGVYSLSQVYMSSVICEDITKELFIDREMRESQKFNIAIVTFDDYHTFGKKLVNLSLTSAGYLIHDYGLIFEEEDLIKRIADDKIDILLMSVLMLPPALRIKELKPRLLEVNPNIKIIVGGAPFRFDKKLYKEIGADGTGATPAHALKLIKEMEEEL